MTRFSFVVFIVALITSGPLQAANLAGKVDRQKGEASRTGVGKASPLNVGSPVFVGDLIITGAGARLIIELNDKATLTLGENAKIAINEMIYTPDRTDRSANQQSIEMFKGVFQFVTGAIGANKPEQVVIKTPVASVGIRGTSFIGGELTVGMPPGQPHYGFQIYEGAVEVKTDLGSVILDEPGEGTFLPLTRKAAPTPVRQWTEEEAREARDALAF